MADNNGNGMCEKNLATLENVLALSSLTGCPQPNQPIRANALAPVTHTFGRPPTMAVSPGAETKK